MFKRPIRNTSEVRTQWKSSELCGGLQCFMVCTIITQLHRGAAVMEKRPCCKKTKGCINYKCILKTKWNLQTPEDNEVMSLPVVLLEPGSRDPLFPHHSCSLDGLPRAASQHLSPSSAGAPDREDKDPLRRREIPNPTSLDGEQS
ncbi:unnamed protein product [Lota lota]